MLCMLFLYFTGAVIAEPFIIYLLYNSLNNSSKDEIFSVAVTIGAILWPLTLSASFGYYITKRISNK